MFDETDLFELFQIDDEGRLFISPATNVWDPVHQQGINVIIDLERGIDPGISEEPGKVLYVYCHIEDDDLPDLDRLHALGLMAASLIRKGQKVLVHCTMGLNRSALLAGVILCHLGYTGADATARVRERRPGALYNDTFAGYLERLDAQGYRG